MPKFLSLVVFVVLVFIGTYSAPVLAESPADFPLVPCADTIPGEFHPLRPYPGTPCAKIPEIPLDTPIFCGAGSFSHDETVPATCGGQAECTFTKNIEYDVTVDLTQVRIPILGNTQDDLDEATQVNNYLNWYLNGTVQQSEQPGFFSPTDPDRLVNFAGPIKKLLPQDIQKNIREKEVAQGPIGSQYHNYQIGQGSFGTERLDSFWKTLLLNIPFSSFEDTPGEVSFSAPGDQPEGVGPVKVTVTSTKNKVYVPHLTSLDKLSTLVTSIFQPFTKNPLPVVLTTSGTCAITKAYTLPTGDSLMGPKIGLHLSYTQKFTYQARDETSGGLPTGATCTQDSDCQSGSCQVSAEIGDTPSNALTCGPAATKVTSTANVTTNNRTPLIDNIFWNLVGSPQSLIRRFAPQTSQIKEGDSAIPAAATDPAGHQVLFAKLGSLFDYILGGSLENINLQRLLRPQGSQRFASAGPGICAVPESGLCSLNDPRTNLSAAFGDQAPNAAQICVKESNGIATALNDSCLPPSQTHWCKSSCTSPSSALCQKCIADKHITHTQDYSVGLFQVNLLAHKINGLDCPSAFSTDSNGYCKIVNPSLLNSCSNYLTDPAHNVEYAKLLSGGGQSWKPWVNSSKACNIPY